MDCFDHILLFKTNIGTPFDRLVLQSLLENDDRINQWSIDMEDVDCVLRIVSYKLSHQCIIELINAHGYYCCELTT